MNVLFLCTGNSCRSQMAEGWTRQLKGDVIEPHSAGTDPKTLDPRAVRAMAEVGVDISGQQPKHVSTLNDMRFDLVITVCDSAREACPVFPGAPRTEHIGFDDPPRLAVSASTEEQAMSHYRHIRDEIKAMVESLPHTGAKSTP